MLCLILYLLTDSVFKCFVAGLLTQLKEEFEKIPFAKGDSADPQHAQHYNEVMTKLDDFLNGEPFTLQVDDPLSNSCILLIAFGSCMLNLRSIRTNGIVI